VSLRYRFQPASEHDQYKTAKPLSRTLGDFDVELRDGFLGAQPRGLYEQSRDAREALEPHLRAWEVSAVLGNVAHDMRFVFESARLEDPDELPGNRKIEVELTETLSFSADAVISRTNERYPDPDPTIIVDPVVEAMLTRWNDVRSDDKLLLPNANWLITRLEDEFGGTKKGSQRRDQAARSNALDPAVLNKVAELAAYNDPERGRKASGPRRSLTDSQVAWLRAAIPILIRQVARYHGTGGLAVEMSMSDLPPLL
jgi:hypothetical protein